MPCLWSAVCPRNRLRKAGLFVDYSDEHVVFVPKTACLLLVARETLCGGAMRRAEDVVGVWVGECCGVAWACVGCCWLCVLSCGASRARHGRSAHLRLVEMRRAGWNKSTEVVQRFYCMEDGLILGIDGMSGFRKILLPAASEVAEIKKRRTWPAAGADAPPAYRTLKALDDVLFFRTGSSVYSRHVKACND